MPLMDEFKQERDAVKNGTPKEKLSYFWYYYKWHVIGGLCILLVAASMIHDMVTHKDSAFHVILLNAVAFENAAEFEDDFALFAGVDTKKFTVDMDTSIYIEPGSYDATTVDSQQKLMAYTVAGDIDLLLSNETMFAQYANNGMFANLDEFLTAPEKERFSGSFYYVDMDVLRQIANASPSGSELKDLVIPDPGKPETMKEPVPVGIYMDDFIEKISAYYLIRGEGTEQNKGLVLGVYANVPHTETTHLFLDFMCR